MRQAILSATCLLCLAMPLAAADALTELYQRLRERELVVNAPDGALDYRATQRADGSWPDVNYADRSQTWSPQQHINRLLAMAVAWGRPGLPTHGDPGLLKGVELALAYWFAVRPTCTNWYKNDIGQQLKIGPTLLIARDALPATLVATGCTFLNDPAMTGANRVWLSTQTIWRGAISGSAADVDKGATAIRGVCVETTGEGVQSDRSFLQHGRQLHLGQYGTTYQHDLVEWATLLRGLPWAFSEAKIQLLGDLLLDGQQWVFRRGQRLPGNSGRAVCRPGALANHGGIDAAAQMLAVLDPARAARYHGLSEHLAGRADGALVGAKHFWRADHFVQRRPGWALAVSMCSTRVEAQESINGENLQGQHYTLGATWLQRDGGEFAEIWPVLDWGRIPGTTVRHVDPAPAPSKDMKGGSAFVGGVSDGSYGAAVYHHVFKAVSARKAWFAFDDEVVMLGAGIDGPTTATAPKPVCTTVEQSRLRGPVSAGTAGGTRTIPAGGSEAVAEARWLHHDGQGYVFPDGGSVTVSTRTQSGSWKEIHQYEASTQISAPVFSAWIDHGPTPAGAGYAYVRLPGADAAATAAWAANPRVAILANSVALQAVRHAALSLTQAVFHQAGRLDLPDGRWLAADQPCVVLWREGQRLTVSRPDAGGALNLTVGTPTTSLVVPFDLPAAPDNGRSVSKDAVLAGGGDPPAADPLVLGVLADASVRGGTYAGTNYGSAPVLEVKLDTSASYTRETFLRFDCSGLSGVEHAELALVPAGMNTDANITTWEVALVADAGDGWSEPLITWTGRPTAMSGLSTTFAGGLEVGAERRIDVTELVRRTLASDPSGRCTLRLRGLAAGSKRQLNLASREHGVLPGPRLLILPLAPAGNG